MYRNIVAAFLISCAFGRGRQVGHAIAMVPQASVVPSGGVHLMELQERGYSYVRP